MTKNEKRIMDAELLLQSDPTLVKFFKWETGFLQDMVYRLKAGRVLTKNQRNKLDELLQKGYPEMPKPTTDLGIKLQQIIPKISNMQKFGWEHNLCVDFYDRLIKGYTLSDKQVALAERIIANVNDVMENAIEITEEIEERIQKLTLAKSLYRNLTGKKYGSLEKVLNYKNEPITIKELEHAEELLSAKLNYLANPRFKSGDMAFHRGKAVLIVKDSQVKNGNVVYDVLVDGQIKSVRCDSLGKRL